MFIQITPEGYTPDGKYRVVPVDIKSEIHSVYHHAMGQGLREQDKQGVLAFHKSVIETAPPPPAEMLVDESALNGRMIFWDKDRPEESASDDAQGIAEILYDRYGTGVYDIQVAQELPDRKIRVWCDFNIDSGGEYLRFEYTDAAIQGDKHETT